MRLIAALFLPVHTTTDMRSANITIPIEKYIKDKSLSKVLGYCMYKMPGMTLEKYHKEGIMNIRMLRTEDKITNE